MLKSLNSFLKLIGYEIEEINSILEPQYLKNYYYQYTKTSQNLNGKIKKRIISPSKNELKDIQNKIVSNIFRKIEFPNHIQGSIKGRSYVTNAAEHVNKIYKYKTDLVNFFSFVNNKQVNNSLIKMGFSPIVSSYITKLTTFQGHLPQGTPTSSYLANIVGLNYFDESILKLCQENEITYTRYVDDLVFSSRFDFKDLTLTINQILLENGFLTSHRKTVYKKGKLEITGAMVSSNLKPTDKQLEKLKNIDTADTTKIGLKHHIKRLNEANKHFPKKKHL